MIEINEYMEKFKPAHHESVLKPFTADLLELRALGYTLAQIQSFLSANNVMVSRSWIGEYIGNASHAALLHRRRAARVDHPYPPEIAPEIDHD